MGIALERMTSIVGWILLVVVSSVVFNLLLIIFPQPLFAYHRTYKNFTVYMREAIPPEITRVLDRAEQRLSASELNDTTLHHEIYIFNSFWLSQYLLLRNVHFGANMGTGDTFITMADVRLDSAWAKKISLDDHRRRTLTESIVHEITHRLIKRRVGRRANVDLPRWIVDLPRWIMEGYCETIAQGSAIDPRLGLAMIQDPTQPHAPGLNYFRARVMIEFLLDIKHMTFEDIISALPDAAQVEAQVRERLGRDQSAFLVSIGWTVEP